MFLFPKIRFGASLAPLVLVFFLSFFSTQNLISQSCDVLICNDTVNVDIELEGFNVIEPDMILEASNFCPGPFQVDVFVNRVSIGDTIRCDLLDEVLKVEVTYLGVPQNSCESYIRVEDKSAPVISCRDTIVPCGVDPDSIALATFQDNCDANSIIFYRDSIVDSFCVADKFNVVIYRTWGGHDNAGNLSFECRQEIKFKKPSLSDVIFQNDTILIDTFSIPITPGNIDSLVGIVPPTIEGHPVGFYCKFNVLWEDQVFPICEGAFKILRKWTVLNCCTAEKREQYQMIEFLDKTPPIITCADTLRQSTSPDDCLANFMLPPAIVTDNNTTNPSVKVEYPSGVLNTNGGIITGLPIGFHDVIYIASDDCGNKDTCLTVVEVVDDTPPIAICIEKLVVNINSRGEGCIRVASFDAGSSDNCFLDSISVKRMDEPDSLFRDLICFYCDDIPGPIMVITQFIDSSGNANRCMTEVQPQDKLAPEITCPADVILPCDADLSDKALTGLPIATDNCDSLRFTFRDDITDLDMCREGMVFRTWYAFDAGDLVDSCVQKITLEDNTPTTFINIPNDTTLFFCPTDLDSLGTGQPEIIADCEQWGMNVKDSIFTQPCTLKVFRTFTFREWCSGVDTVFKQEITIIDTSPPTWAEPNGGLDEMVQCAADVAIPPTPTPVDFCADSIDLRLVKNDSIAGTCVNDFLQIFGYVAEDNCGNVSDTFFIKITVRDTVPPEIVGVPNDTIIGCDASVPEPNIVLSDNCGPPNFNNFVEISLPITCPETEKTRQIWIAEDACGNIDSVERILTKIDTVPPTALTPTDSIYACPEDIPAADPEVVFGETDNCSLPVSVTLFQNDTIDNRCLDTLFRIYRITDACGNFTDVTHTIIVKDTIPPRVQSCPGMRTDSILSGFNMCEGLIQNLDATYLDNCPANVVTITNDSPHAFSQDSSSATGIYPTGIHRFKFYGTDECLNVNDLCEVELTVVEGDPPQIFLQSPAFLDLDSNGMAMAIGEDVFNPELTRDWCSPVLFSVSPDKFDCADYNSNALHQVDVIAIASDTFGNAITVQNARLTLRDPFGVCMSPPPAPPGSIGGVIASAKNQRMRNVLVKMSGDRTGSFTTNRMGSFQFEDLEAGDNLIFEPYKNDETVAGVSTFDLMLISKIVLGNPEDFTPLQHIAADANRDGKVTVRDIIEVRKLILNPSLQFSNNTSWRFVRKNYVFQNRSNPLLENFPENIEQIHQHSDFEMDFIGVKVGDLNNDSMTDSLQTVSDRNARASSFFMIENQSFKSGETVILKIKSSEELAGFQFALDFDESILKFEKMTSKMSGLTENHFNFSNTENGFLPISFNGNISANETIFEIEFTAKKLGNLDEMIRFNHQKLNGETYLSNLEIKKTAIQFVEPKEFSSENEEEITFELFQNSPNPFSNQTTISCRLKKEMNVQLEIFDMTGRVVFEDRKRFTPGIRTFEINNRFFRESGVYTYKLTTPFGVKTKRMIFIK